MTLVRLSCWWCAQRYAHVVHPAGPVCAGAGVVAVQVPDGVEPIVAARATSMPSGLAVVADSPDAEGLADVPTDYLVRSRIGRAAGDLCVQLGLRPPKPRKPPPTKEGRAERAARRKAERDALERTRETTRRWAAERANKQRRQEVAARAAQAIAEAHPEELVAQEVFVALEEGFGSYLPPAVRRVMES